MRTNFLKPESTNHEPGAAPRSSTDGVRRAGVTDTVPRTVLSYHVTTYRLSRETSTVVL